MTYNQVVSMLRSLLQSHAMIKTVKLNTPTEWLNRDEQPVLPVALFAINTGSLNRGREQVYNVEFWFLDKSGQEAEFETDVVSDQIQIAADITSTLRKESNDFLIDDNVGFTVVSERFEDYLSGVNLTINLSTVSDFDACDMPTI